MYLFTKVNRNPCTCSQLETGNPIYLFTKVNRKPDALVRDRKKKKKEIRCTCSLNRKPIHVLVHNSNKKTRQLYLLATVNSTLPEAAVRGCGCV